MLNCLENFWVYKMNIIILAAGKGTRLGIHNNNKPKCLYNINGISLIERNLMIFKGFWWFIDGFRWFFDGFQWFWMEFNYCSTEFKDSTPQVQI